MFFRSNINDFISAKYKYRKAHKKRNSKKKKFLDYFILFLTAAFYNINNYIQVYFGEIYKGEESSALDLYVNDSLQIIFLTIITYFFLKYKYYIHHIISIIIFVVLSIIIDLILGYYYNKNIYTFISSLVSVFVNSFNFSYFKYLIEEKYYYSLDIIYIYGIIRLILYLIIMPVILSIQNKNNNH